jgi:hypothetical protein
MIINNENYYSSEIRLLCQYFSDYEVDMTFT